MQPLTAPPRDELTDGQVTDLLTGPDLEVSSGLELLDSSNALVQDISDDLAGGEIDRNCYADVHGTCRLQISRALAWGAVRVRPYMTLTSGATSARFDLGVYILTTPDNPVGETPQTWDAAGFDLLYMLNQPIRDAIQKPAGTNVLQAVRDVITAAGVTVPVLLDSTADAKTLSADMTWAPDNSQVPTWLNVVNALLATVSYRGMWADWDGTYRSEPYLAPVSRGVEWTHTADDELLTLIGESRTVSQDLWPVPNWWRFIQNGLTAAPVEGAGQYTYQTPDTDPTSAASLGFYKSKWQWLDAADQASLQAQGDAIVQADRQVTQTYKTPLAPFPAMWHADVVTLIDTAAGGTYKALGHSWTLPLDGSDMTVQFDIIQ